METISERVAYQEGLVAGCLMTEERVAKRVMPLIDTLREYLNYSSIDGKPERVVLRKKLADLINHAVVKYE